MTALILSGGENRRIPVIKGFIEVDGKRTIESQIELLRGIFDRVVISTNTPELYFYLGLPMIGDIIGKGKGPMSGILSTLLSTGEDEIFVIACDMPFIKPDLIRHILQNRAKDATIPVFNGRPEPLMAVYTKNIIGVMKKRIEKGRTSLRDMLGEINVRYINDSEIRAIDQKGRSFVNINTEDDLKQLREEVLR
ncbi:MAG: molybdenum cofactor guanylyltransferase [Nitrospirae bacterium]|nr:molybdenum cofactor guanylyltransferase [Nitrospirota bacterium]